MLDQHQQLVAKARARLELQVRRARTDLGTFIELCVRDDHGISLRLEPMHRAWITHLDYCWSHNYQAMIMAHWGAGKSACLVVPMMAHMIGRDRNIRIKIVTNEDDNAIKRVSAVRKIIETPLYRQVFPLVAHGDSWTGHELYVKRIGHAIDPTIQARGIFTTGVSARCDLMVFDDVVDQKNAMDPAQRKRVLSFLDDTWLSRLEPDGNALLVGTTWHQDDAMHHIMQRGRWCTLRQRVSTDCTEILQEVIGGGPDYPGLAKVA
jgi:hypothetical protein